jgi:hypothetical protein
MRYLCLLLYGLGFGLLGHGWYSDILPLSTKVILSVVAVALLGFAGLIQWKGTTRKE